MRTRSALLHRVVQPGERLEWMQRVQAGKPLDVSQAPAKLQVGLLFTLYLLQQVSACYRILLLPLLPKQTPYAKGKRPVPSVQLLVEQLCITPTFS